MFYNKCLFRITYIHTIFFTNHLFLHLRSSFWDHFLSWSISFRRFFNQYGLVVRKFCCTLYMVGSFFLVQAPRVSSLRGPDFMWSSLIWPPVLFRSQSLSPFPSLWLIKSWALATCDLGMGKVPRAAIAPALSRSSGFVLSWFIWIWVTPLIFGQLSRTLKNNNKKIIY